MTQFFSQEEIGIHRHSRNFLKRRNGRLIIWLVIGVLASISGGELETPVMAAENSQVDSQTLLTTVQEYAQAVAQGDTIQAGQRDFVCLYKMKLEKKAPDGQFADPSDPIYDWCAQRRAEAHDRAIAQRDRALDAVWPGKGQLVDFTDFQRLRRSNKRK